MTNTTMPGGAGDTDLLTLPLHYHIPDDLRLTFADNVAIQNTPTEFTISFGQAHQPIVMEAAEYDAMKAIRVDVVARIVMTPPKMLAFIKALQDNWKVYQRRMEALMEQQANVGEPESNHPVEG
jgi:hypothetical protein